eukprot:TRINITY_DN13022_c0_g1_i6.p3 TRINITY_DN13022_c0_g1~~TRINITY_DN13022_c0_g1_i6.p3  ORF type:complete len:232 (-),score=66.13 TRINITY_DN13022_c0_g1_i6:167-862(-)
MTASKLLILGTKLIASTAIARPAPTTLYYPGLQSNQFHDLARFSFTEVLRENLKAIQSEFAYLKEVYKVNDYTPVEDKSVVAQGNMQWMTFWDFGKPNEDVRKLCPRTTKLLETIPDLVSTTPYGRSFFLRLGPATSLRPHSSSTNIKLRCHLSLSVPGEGFLRVGGKFAQWEEGKMLVFDGSYSHELVNLDKDKEKSILAFDVWHPDLTKEERGLLVREYTSFLEKQNKS